jgi:hypothetical protein
MATATRLKAAYVAPYQFLGDMTNSVVGTEMPMAYVLGLLNSRVLNWRIKLTSTNNYLSAAEIEALPIPRVESGRVTPAQLPGGTEGLTAILPRLNGSLVECVGVLDDTMAERLPSGPSAITATLIAWAVASQQMCATAGQTCPEGMPQWRNLVDALVLKLFGIEQYAAVIET